MKTKKWAFLTIILCTVCTTFAAIANKEGATRLEMSLKGTILNGYLILGLFLLAMGMVLLTISLKGGDVSVIYPFIATSYIWVTLLAPYFFNEPITMLKAIGVGLIVAGVIMINIGNNSNNAVDEAKEA